MQDAIRTFNTQFAYEPRVENRSLLKDKKKYIVAGMGGSHLAADIIASLRPELHITVHCDYGLPSIPSACIPETLVICSSYSGNTEEVLEVYDQARSAGLSVAAIAVGGELIERAQRDQVPYVQMPDTGIQPRSALGLSLRGLCALMGLGTLLEESYKLAESLDPLMYEKAGKALANRLKDRVPVVYSSRVNRSLAYNWKIKFNETGKIPAFYNFFSELNHNEMTGFDVKKSSRHLSERFYFIFLKDLSDHPKILKRMDVLKTLYEERKLEVEFFELKGETASEKIFSSLLLADWAAFYLAKHYGLESEQVPMVEEFKTLIV